MTIKVTKKSTKTEVLYLCFCKFANYYAQIILITMINYKLIYVKPECQELDAQPLNYVLMGSNEGYDVDPFDPFND